MTKIKICGIKNLEELKIAEHSGCDAVGFLIGQRHNAHGFISEQLAKNLCIKASPFISTVIVTHIENADELIQLINNVPATTIQIHSDISIKTLKLIKDKARFIKILGKVSVQGVDAINRALELQDYVDGILLDSIDPMSDKVGGTGKIHDWSISEIIVKRSIKPVILAGGLNPNNVQSAISSVKPWGVDSNTGLRINHELSADLATSFVNAVRRI